MSAVGASLVPQRYAAKSKPDCSPGRRSEVPPDPLISRHVNDLIDFKQLVIDHSLDLKAPKLASRLPREHAPGP